MIHMKVKNNKMLFDSRDWIIIATLISNNIFAIININ